MGPAPVQGSGPWQLGLPFQQGWSCPLWGGGLRGTGGGLSGSECHWAGDSCPSKQLPSFLSAQPAPRRLGLTARMELGPATETFVLELRCLEDGGPAPDTLSGEGLGGPLTS